MAKYTVVVHGPTEVYLEDVEAHDVRLEEGMLVLRDGLGGPVMLVPIERLISVLQRPSRGYPAR